MKYTTIKEHHLYDKAFRRGARWSGRLVSVFVLRDYAARRLMLANPRLSALITEAIGDKWHTDAEALRELLPLREDAAFRESFARVKRENKLRLSQWLILNQREGFDPDCLLDVQAKRLHEYKRQLLNALHLLVLYNRIVDNPDYDMPPRCVIVGAKASPGLAACSRVGRSCPQTVWADSVFPPEMAKKAAQMGSPSQVSSSPSTAAAAS